MMLPRLSRWFRLVSFLLVGILLVSSVPPVPLAAVSSAPSTTHARTSARPPLSLATAAPAVLTMPVSPIVPPVSQQTSPAPHLSALPLDFEPPFADMMPPSPARPVAPSSNVPPMHTITSSPTAVQYCTTADSDDKDIDSEECSGDAWKDIPTSEEYSLAPKIWFTDAPNGDNLHREVWFRHQFYLDDDYVTFGELSIIFDDFAIVSLNGREVLRDWKDIDSQGHEDIRIRTVGVAPQPGWNELLIKAKNTHTDYAYVAYRIEFPRAATLPVDQARAPEANTCSVQPHVGGPINTRSGNLWMGETDLRLPTAGPPLVWERSYNSHATDASTALGHGWQPAVATHLDITTAPVSVTVVSARGNHLRFWNRPDGTFLPAPGVVSTLERFADGTYIHTLRDQTRHVFDADGVFRSIVSPQGWRITLGYDAAARVAEIRGVSEQDDRVLFVTYDTDPRYPERITRVGDATSREVAYTYDAANTLIRATVTMTDTTVTPPDVVSRTTSYSYTGHLLTRVTNTLGQTVEETTYETPHGPTSRVTHQVLQDGRTLHLAYTQDTTLITTTDRLGQVQTVERLVYDDRAVLVGRVLTDHATGESLIEHTQHGGTFALNGYTNSNDQHTTQMTNQRGLPLTITNALHEQTVIAYTADGFKPTRVTDADGTETTLTYQHGLLNQMTRHGEGLEQTAWYTATCGSDVSISTNHAVFIPLVARPDLAPMHALGQIPSQVTHPATSLAASSLPTVTLCLLDAMQTTDGVVTHVGHTDRGHVVTTTVGVTPADQQVTTMTYDHLDRLASTTVAAGTPLARRDVIRYTPDDAIAATILNYQDGQHDAHDAHDEDVITTYAYDALGRRVLVCTALHMCDATHYNALGQVEWTSTNLTPVVQDADGQPLLQPFDPAMPGQNITTHYDYDSMGHVTLITQTGVLAEPAPYVAATATPPTFAAATTRVTHIASDGFGRPVTITRNYRPDLADAARPDTNIQEHIRYDRAGNVIGRRDGLGRWTVTAYDALNRPTQVTQNYENGDPLTIDPAHAAWASDTVPDTDLITQLSYDSQGRHTAQVAYATQDAGAFRAPDTNRRTTMAYDGLGRLVTRTRNEADALQADTNLTQHLFYDARTGRLSGSQDETATIASPDVLPRFQHMQYDEVGRLTATTQHCTDAAGTPKQPGTGPCAAFDPATPDRNIRTHRRYDALNRLTEIVQNSYTPAGTPPTTPATDTLVTQFTYDALGRPRTRMDNVVNGIYETHDGPHDDDVVTTYATDVLGHTTLITRVLDAERTAVTRLAYDDGRNIVTMTDPLGQVTRIGSDGLGQVRWVLAPSGRVTLFDLDGLGRVTTTIANYADGQVSAQEPTDQDVRTRTVYDAAGRVVARIAADGAEVAQTQTTIYTMTLRDTLAAVTENAWPAHQGACPNAPCNVTTHYGYDRAGNLTSVVDANGHTRSFTSDAADRVVAQTDPLGQQTAWTYDARGRMTDQDDPRGEAYDQTYTYDDQDRLTGIASDNLTRAITMAYDGLGRRTRMVDTSGTTTFTVNRAGRITATQFQPADGSPAWTVGVGYTAQGQRRWLTYPAHTASVTYTYRADGRMQTVQRTDATEPLVQYAYDADGRLVQDVQLWQPTTGMTTTYAYDGADRLRSRATDVQGRPFARFDYAVNRLGLRTVITETLPIRMTSPYVATSDMAHQAATAEVAQPSVSAPLDPPESVLSCAPVQMEVTAVGMAANNPQTITVTAAVWSVVQVGGKGFREPMPTAATITLADGTQQRVAPVREVEAQGVSGYTFGVAGVPGVATAHVETNGDTPKALVAYAARPTTTAWSNAMTTTLQYVWGGDDGRGATGPATIQLRLPAPVSATTTISVQVVVMDKDAHAGNDQRIVHVRALAGGIEAATTLTDPDEPQVNVVGLTLSGVPTGTQEVQVVVESPETPAGQSQWNNPAAGDSVMVLGAVARHVCPPPAPTEMYLGTERIVTNYAYDGVQRLIGAASQIRWEWDATPLATEAAPVAGVPAGRVADTELTATRAYSYSYDLVGNRTGRWMNGTRELTHTFNAANQVIGWTYDTAGNLLSDGTGTSTYDALNRLVQHNDTPYAYNGDGILMQAGDTRYVQDLAAPLAQVLALQRGNATQSYVYGRERLATLTTAPGGHTHFVADALGSTRVTFTETDPWGTFAATRFTPFGEPYAPDLPPGVYVGDSIGVPQPTAPFGFTGELHDAGLVYLRARWYNPTSGVFLSRDPFGGFATRPYSLHPYQYGYANPVVWTDASGRCVGWIWDDPTCQFAGYNPRDWSWNESLDTWQVGLDVAGMVPVLGEPADALNTGISLARGDCVGAGLSLAAMVPLAGWGATAGKVGRRGVKLLPAPKVRGRANPIGQRGPFYVQQNGIISNELGPGTWQPVNESMSHRARVYQEKITGNSASVGHVVHGVKFDGYRKGILIDAKGPGYAGFVNSKTGTFHTWYKGTQDLLDQASRQTRAAGNTPIEWHVAEEDAANAIRTVLQDAGHDAITVKHVP